MTAGDLLMDSWNYDRLLGLVIGQHPIRSPSTGKKVGRISILWSNGVLEEMSFSYCKQYMRILASS